VGHRIVAAVDGQGVLDQVVGADREEIQAAQEGAECQRRGGNLDHAADLDRVELLPRLAQLEAGQLDQAQGLFDLLGMGQHRDQQAHPAVVRGAQDRAQLHQEELRLGQAEADRAQAQGRVGAARLPVRLRRARASLSAPMSSVRMVTGLPASALTTLR
jgi:hypothetical protein